MNTEELITKIKEKTGMSAEEIVNKVNLKVEQLSGLITKEGALNIIAHESGIKVTTMPINNEIVEDLEVEEEIISIVNNNNEEDLSLDDLGKKYIKNPKVGEEVEFTINKVVKSKDIEAVDKKGKKFKTNLTSVDYKIIYKTTNDEEFAPKAWEVVGKINAILKKLKQMKGVKIKVKHIEDGLVKKDIDCYDVLVSINNEWKRLNRETKEFN